jgi:hypothetical protein
VAFDSCCGLSFISGVRRNRTEFDYCGLFGSASAVVKPNPLSNNIFGTNKKNQKIEE